MRPQQEIENKIKSRQTIARRIQLATSIGLRIGTVSFLSAAIALFMSDYSRLEGSYLAYTWSLSNENVMPGSWVTGKLLIPEASELGEFSLRFDLPTTSGLRLVPGSLELYSGSLEGAKIPGYSGATSLVIEGIPQQQEAMHLEIAIQVSSDLTMLGKTVQLTPSFDLSGQWFEAAPAALRIDAPQMKVVQKPVAASLGRPGFEILVQNPINGLDFIRLGESFDLELILTEPGVNIQPAEVQILANEWGGTVNRQDDGILVSDLSISPGDLLTMFVPLKLPDGLSATNVSSFSRVRVGDATLGEGRLTRAQASSVIYESFAGDLRDGRALLTWKVLKEQSNKAFVVEHSQNGTDFESLVMLPGSEDHHEAMTYQFETELLSKGRHLFRLRQEDFTEKSQYTHQIALMVGYEEPVSIDVSSFSETGMISVAVPTGRKASIYLSKPGGNILQTLFDGHLKPRSLYDIFVDSDVLNSGNYEVVFESGITKKVVGVQI